VKRRWVGTSLLRLLLVTLLATPAIVTWGCGTEGVTSLFNDDAAAPVAVDDATAPWLTPTDAGASSDAGCTGLECKRVTCADGGTTSLSGIVVSPRPGDPDPLYNAVVYVPNAPVEPFKPGVSCDRCGAPASGSPIAVALTGIDGKFQLDNVPVTDDLPLVIQIGRWRRQVTVPHVAACADTPLTTDLTRLPRSQAEGDIPLMALKRGDSDSPECVLRKMGIVDGEFTQPDGGGRIEVYTGLLNVPPTLDGGAPDASTLLEDATRMQRYDLVLLPCDGNTFTPTPESMQNLETYANLGGRVFASHYSYEFIKNAPNPSLWPNVVTWAPNPTLPGPSEVVPGYINTTFPKGQAMSQWLEQFGAADGGVIPTLWQPRRDVDGVNGETLTWITTKAPDKVNHFSFNTPVGVDAGDQCGRVVFNDFHTVNVFGGQTGVFPAECSDPTQPLTPQERVFEFMLFDLSSCVQKDDAPPVPPPGVVH
jgi:hypothetical protein